MVAPPKQDAKVPRNVHPPFVPLGTFLVKKDVMSLGSFKERIPNSLAQVSPFAQL